MKYKMQSSSWLLGAVVVSGLFAGVAVFAGAPPPAQPCRWSQQEIFISESFKNVCVVDGYNTYVVCDDGSFSRGTNGMVGGTLEHRAQWAYNQCPKPPSQLKPSDARPDGSCLSGLTHTAGGITHMGCVCPSGMTPPDNYPSSPCSSGLDWCSGGVATCPDGSKVSYGYCAGVTTNGGSATEALKTCPETIQGGGCAVLCPDGVNSGSAGMVFVNGVDDGTCYTRAQAQCPSGLPPLTGSDLAMFESCRTYCTDQKRTAQCGAPVAAAPAPSLGPTGGESLVYQGRTPAAVAVCRPTMCIERITGNPRFVDDCGNAISSCSGGAGGSISASSFSANIPNLVDMRPIVRDPSWQMNSNPAASVTSLGTSSLSGSSLSNSALRSTSLSNVGALSSGLMFR